jgi:lipopolysaccharide/colanic/teichoic acid biosynthesis glycosyltransferase
MGLYNPYGKRILDIVFTSIGIVPLLPVMGIIALLIKLEDGGSVIFKHERVGYRFKKFKLYKFRTMVENAQKLGPSVTKADDPRITRLGKFLRKYKLDELPQLFNVLKGDISLVGPRPEVEKYIKHYEEDFKEILWKVKPGITDYATLEFRNEEEMLKGYENTEKVYLEEVLPKKIELYKKYTEDVSLLTDLKLIFKTLWRIVKG